MSAFQRGAGIAGIVSLPGVGVQFSGRFYRWQPRLQGNTRPRRGRGGGVWRSIRWLFSSGTIAITGSLPPNDCPAPGTWEQTAGTITVPIIQDKSVTYPICVTAHGYDFDEKKQETPNLILSVEITGPPTYTGFSGQPSVTPPTKADQEQWEGTSKTLDPNGLQSAAVRLIDVWGVLADTDSAEGNKLASVIAAAVAPMASLKLRTATFARDAVDGGTVSIQWGLTDTKDDVLLPRNTYSNDPARLQDVAHTAAINAAAPNPPTGAQAFVLRARSSVKLNDGTTLNEADYGLRTTAEDVSFPGTWTKVDPKDLTSTGLQTNVYNPDVLPVPPAAIPTGQAIRNASITRLNDIENQIVREYAKDDSKQEAEQAKSFLVTDPNNLTSEAAGATVDNPNPPLPAGFVDRGVRVENVTHDHQIYQRVGGLRSTQDDVEMPQTFATLDPKAIDSAARTMRVYDGQGSGPPDPAAPSSELQVVGRKTQRLNILRSAQEITWDVLDSEQKRGFPKVETTTDPQNIDSHAVRYKFFAHGAATPAAPDDPPTGLNAKLIHSDVLRVTPTRDMALYVYGAKSTRDELVLKNYETSADAGALESTAVRSALDGESISDPSGYVLVTTKTIPVTDGLTTNRVLTVKIYGLKTSKDAIELAGTHTHIDPQGLSTEGIKTSVYTGSVPSDPTPPSGTQIVGSEITQLTTAGTAVNKKAWDFAVVNSAQKITYPESPAVVSSIENYKAKTASIVTVTDTMVNMATAALTAAAGDTTVNNVMLKQLTPTQALQVFEKAGDNKLIEARGRTHAFEDHVMGRPHRNVFKTAASWGTSYAESYIRASGVPGVGFTKGWNQGIKDFRVRHTLHYRRRFVTTSTPEAYYFISQQGTTNAAALLGFPAHALMYDGPLVQFNYSLGFSHLLIIDYQLTQDNWFWMNDGELPYGELYVAQANITFSGSGIGPLSLFDPNAAMLWAPESDLSVLTTAV